MKKVKKNSKRKVKNTAVTIMKTNYL